MAEIIPFPATTRTGLGMPEPVDVSPVLFAFGANLYFTRGAGVGYAISYPNGPVSRATVAGMLRKVADMIDKTP